MNSPNASNASERAPMPTTAGSRGVGGAPDTLNPLAFISLNHACRGVGLSVYPENAEKGVVVV
jgi:hypothetical protein